MSASVLIEAVEVEGFGGGGVVTPSFGDVQVAGVLIAAMMAARMVVKLAGPAAGSTGRGVLAEGHVAGVVVCLDGPVLADQAGQVLCGGAAAGQAGDGVDGLAGGLAGGGVLPPAGDLDGLAAQGKSRRLTCVVLRVRVSVQPCPVSRVVLPAGTCRQGSALIRACSSGWFFFTTAM
jgi:hypothetical protein